MKTIWKYQLYTGAEEQCFEIPGWSGVAHVDNQDGFANTVTVWCHVDTKKPKYIARFLVRATGDANPDNGFFYVGTALCGEYVWHVWRNAITEYRPLG